MIVIDGKGLLAEFVYGQLMSHYQIARQSVLSNIPHETKLVLVLADTWQPAVHQQVEEKLRAEKIPWLRGFVAFGEGVIGPFIQPGKQGCSHCADKRRILADSDAKELWGLYLKLANETKSTDMWATRSALRQMALLFSEEVHHILSGKPSDLNKKLWMMNLKTFSNSSHHFSYDPKCPICSIIPEDTPELAEIRLSSSPKIAGAGYRCRSMEDLKSVLDYYDHRTGILNAKVQDWTLPFADVLMNMPLFGVNEGVAGRSNSYAISELTAILEGLERYCGLEPRGKKQMVYDSYQHIKDYALNPLSVGVHETEQYKKEGFPFKPFQANEPMNWVWGYSLSQKRPLLVPQLLAYYSLGYGNGFVYETSNGCAIGGSIEEAIFHGMMEVVERDSFLLTWYAKLPLPRLDLHSIDDKELQLMIHRIREVAGYDLILYNSTMEHGIPSIWAMAKNRSDKGVNIICAAGANPDPIRAVKSAVYELAGMVFVHDKKLAAKRKKYEEMLVDPYQVQSMEDHGMLYGLREAEAFLAFLLNGKQPMSTFAEAFKQPSTHTDLKEDVLEMLQTFSKCNLDVIVVDQTTPTIKDNGLYCVKVIIPGMLPMTFGHHLTRVKGLDRVLDVPAQLGFRDDRLSIADLNPYPHPFP